MTGPSSHLPIMEPGRYCNARRKQEEGYCQLPSGWGTDHPGLGRCKLHGGATPYKGGKRSKVYTMPFDEFLLIHKLERTVGELVKAETDVGAAMARLYKAAERGNVGVVFSAIEKLRRSHSDLTRLCERINELWAIAEGKAGSYFDWQARQPSE